MADRIEYIVNNIKKELLENYTDKVGYIVKSYMNFANIVLEQMQEERSINSAKIKCLQEIEESKNIIEATAKIFDYKKMNKLLIKNGYEAIRQKGDHRIFNNGIKSIPVPQHGLGKGLSCKIQKEIK